MEDLFPFALDPDLVLTVLSALAGFLIVVTVWSALTERQAKSRQARVIQGLRDQMRGQLMEPRRRERGDGRKGSQDFMQKVVVRFDLMRRARDEAITLKLAQAGWRSRDSAIAYLFFKLVMPLAMGVLSFLYVRLLLGGQITPMNQTFVVLGAIFAGYFAPEVYIRNAVTKRQQALQKGLPDSLDLMVICAEAGLSLDATLARVAREMERSCPQMTDELSVTSVELGFLPERRQALENLGKRTDMASVRSVVNTLMQTERYGTPLASALRILANEFRQERMLRAENKAARLPAVLTVPMIIFILPALFVVLLGPGILKALDAFSRM